jgi:hypothetical protein
MNLNDRLRTKGIVSTEYIGGKFDRMAIYYENGTLKLMDYPDLVPGQGWPPAKEIILRNWEEICRLRDFLNSLTLVSVGQAREEADHLERIA